MLTPTSPILRFGIFEVNRQTGELRRKGQKVKLQDQPFQVLAALLERPGEVVTREELCSRPELTISPDKKTILYTQLDALSREIMLVENFR